MGWMGLMETRVGEAGGADGENGRGTFLQAAVISSLSPSLPVYQQHLGSLSLCGTYRREDAPHHPGPGCWRPMPKHTGPGGQWGEGAC